MYQVKVNNSGNYLFNVKSKEHELLVDMKGIKGVTPPDILLASIGTCLGVYLQKYFDGAKIEAGDFSLSVDAEFSKDPLCFRAINVSIDLKGLNLDERRQKGMLEFIKNCPVHNTLKNNPEFIIKINQ